MVSEDRSLEPRNSITAKIVKKIGDGYNQASDLLL